MSQSEAAVLENQSR